MKEDLRCRLHVFPITVPPLRERRGTHEMADSHPIFRRIGEPAETSFFRYYSHNLL
jgi:transcriptional regulator of acetoin/glycerol metabolism